MKQIEGNIKDIGKIHIMPRKVYWVGIPESIRDKDKIEFLTRDIWTISYPAEKIKELENENDVILFLNLDDILLRGRKIQSMEFLTGANGLIKDVQNIKPLHAIAHTTHINPQLSNVFKKSSITYIEKNLHEVNSALNTVIRTVDFIYERTNRMKREHLRIEVEDKSAIPVKLNLEKNKRKYMAVGHVKNLSLGGLQIGFDDDTFNQIIEIKDILELMFPLGPYQIKIQKAITARLNHEEKSVGVYFDIKNEKMVRDFHANQYMEILYHWVKEIIKSAA